MPLTHDAGSSLSKAWRGKNIRHLDAAVLPRIQDNEVRLRRHVPAYDMGNFLGTPALPDAAGHRSIPRRARSW